MTHQQIEALERLDPESPKNEYTRQFARILGVDWAPQMPRAPRSKTGAACTLTRGPEGLDAAVERILGVDAAGLTERNRRLRLVHARRMAWFVGREYMGLSFAQLGRIYHRNHSTILRGCNAVRDKLAAPGTLALIERICKEVGIDTNAQPRA
jgi:hypothetical protein